MYIRSKYHVSCFFFFKQKTAYEMRISDWSSDVCSSDLPSQEIRPAARESVGATPPPKEQPPRKLSGQQDRAGWNGHSGKRSGRFCRNHRRGDRKSTRLNSSH